MCSFLKVIKLVDGFCFGILNVFMDIFNMVI